jgi:hypothetical protein
MAKDPFFCAFANDKPGLAAEVLRRLSSDDAKAVLQNVLHSLEPRNGAESSARVRQKGVSRMFLRS